MKLIGLYTLQDIPNLKQNHGCFAEFNNLEYKNFHIRNHYEKWALVYHLLESHPGETLVFIDAFSYFVSPDFDLDLSEPIIIQELHGKVMDNFFVVRSCQETRKIFHEMRRHSAQRFTGETNFLFELPLSQGTAKPYGYQTQSGKRFHLDLTLPDSSKNFVVNNLPLGFCADEKAVSRYSASAVSDILVAKYGGVGWGSQFISEADILCHHRPREDEAATDLEFEIVNPGKKLALVTLSCSEPGIPAPEYAKVSERNFREYAQHQDVTLYIHKAIPSELKGLHSTWTKPYLVLRHLPQHEYISWIDADMLISKDFRIPVGEDVVVYNDPGAWHFNAGFITFRNSEKTIAFLHAVIARCEALDDRSSLYINGSDQTQFIEEYLVYFPDSLPRSNLVANIPTVLDKLREPGAGLWHFMGLNPPSIRAIVMDYYDSRLQNDDELQRFSMIG